MSSWKVIPTIVLATVLIFGAGVFTGGFLVNSVKSSRPKKTTPHVETAATNNVVNSLAVVPTNGSSSPNAKSVRPPEILSKQFLQQLDESLHLKPEQREAIQKIINEGQNLIRKAVQDSRLEIREVLAPEQRAQFDELVKRPFHKPIFGTNAPSAMMNPENQGKMIEAERSRALNLTKERAELPSPIPTNAP